MRNPHGVVTDVRFTAGGARERRRGLLGWVSCNVDDFLCLDGLTLRRTTDGRLALSFPSKRDGTGRQRPYVRPVDDQTRRAFEIQVFDALGLETDLVE